MPGASTSRSCNEPALLKAIEAFKGARILIIGDIMLDEYLTGDAERISPEAPVPVVRVQAERHLIGGAGNVARNITALGGTAVLIGSRGGDAAGGELERCLDRDGVLFSLLTLEDRPTTIKTRVLARQQQVVRIDREDASPLGAERTQTLLALAAKELSTCGAIVISDYGKGLVSAELMQGLQERIQGCGRAVPVLVDPKPQNFQLYKGVSLLTPNAKETSESVNMPVKTSREVVSAGREIIKRLDCKHLVTTLGGQGMAVFENARQVRHIPTAAMQVFDVTGAGDTVISTLALGAAAGQPLLVSCLLANHAAGIVVAQVGAATASAEALADAVQMLPIPEIDDWSSL